MYSQNAITNFKTKAQTSINDKITCQMILSYLDNILENEASNALCISRRVYSFFDLIFRHVYFVKQLPTREQKPKYKQTLVLSNCLMIFEESRKYILKRGPVIAP